jgi:hypothetical protein
MIIDRETGKELHSEEVAVTFLERESKYQEEKCCQLIYF